MNVIYVYDVLFSLLSHIQLQFYFAHISLLINICRIQSPSKQFHIKKIVMKMKLAPPIE